jgi:hypothetical protein
VAGHGSLPHGSSVTTTSPQTIPQTTTTSTLASTTTTSTQTTTTPAQTKDVCLASGRLAFAKSLGARRARVSIRISQGSNGMPQCSYGVSSPRKGGPRTRVVVTVNVDNGPQAAWRLMRKVVEAAQLFGPAPPGWHAPLGLYGLGPYASWFVNLHALMAVNHTRTELLTATVSWKRAKRAEMIALARPVIVAYIRAPAKAHPITVSGY